MFGTSRKSISKKVRFEVFKRDKFTCQYCGRTAPDVVLEVDHIHPVAEDGENDMMNLITSCFDCNRGKGARLLSDDVAVKKQHEQLKELQDRKEQLEMMLEWRNGLQEIHNESADIVANEFKKCTGYPVNDHGKQMIKKWLKKYSVVELLDAIEVSVDTYFFEEEDTNENANIAFNKIPGICRIKKLEESGESDKRFFYFNYTVKAINNNHWYCDKQRIRKFIFSEVDDDVDFDEVKECLKYSKNWAQFSNGIEKNFGYIL